MAGINPVLSDCVIIISCHPLGFLLCPPGCDYPGVCTHLPVRLLLCDCATFLRMGCSEMGRARLGQLGREGLPPRWKAPLSGAGLWMMLVVLPQGHTCWVEWTGVFESPEPGASSISVGWSCGRPGQHQWSPGHFAFCFSENVWKSAVAGPWLLAVF